MLEFVALDHYNWPDFLAGFSSDLDATAFAAHKPPLRVVCSIIKRFFMPLTDVLRPFCGC